MRENERAPAPFGEDDPLLRDLVAGELALDDPAVRERLGVDPEFASAVRDFERLTSMLDHVGTDEQELLRRALADLPGRSGEEVDPPDLAGAAALEPGVPSARRWRAALVAAAAAALVVWLAWPDSDPPSSPAGLAALEGRMLAGSDFEVRIEETVTGTALRWDLEAGMGWFDVVVLEELPGGERMLFEHSECFESELALDPAPWKSSEHPIVIRVEQHVEGIAGPVRQGSLWLPAVP